MTKSFPGLCGKPRKLTPLAKRPRQVEKRLSQPNVTVSVGDRDRLARDYLLSAPVRQPVPRQAEPQSGP
jgi:hypothetical protein